MNLDQHPSDDVSSVTSRSLREDKLSDSIFDAYLLPFSWGFYLFLSFSGLTS